MNVTDFRRMYDFVSSARTRFLKAFRDLGWKEATRDRGATWDSLHGIFVHILEVEDSWLYYDITGKPWPYGERTPEAFDSFDAVEAYDRELTEKTRAFLEGLEEDDLRRMVVPEGWEEEVLTVEDILIHNFIDAIAHLGEMVALFWQIDAEPPWVNWSALHKASGG